jgi:putative spermidine/putrescine transport system substrate-binding protein
MTTGKALKRLAFAAVLAAAAVALAMPPASAEERFDGVTLRVATFGGLWKKFFEDRIVPKFEKLGGKIEFVTGSPQANLAKLIAARGKAPFDVFEILDAQEGDVLGSEFLQKWNLDKVPNKKFLEGFQYSDHFVATWTTQEAICYNTEKFKELGIPRPTTYKDLAHPKLEGRVMIPDINSGGGLANFGGIVYAAGGDEKNVRPGLDLIASLKIRLFWSAGEQLLSQFQTGDIYAGVAHAGWCLRTRNAGVPVTTVHPKINDRTTGVHKYGWMTLMRSTTDPKVIAAGHWFINEYLDRDYQLYFAKEMGVAPVNRDSIPRMGDDPIVKELLETDPAKLKNFLRIDYTKVKVADWTDQWNRRITK